MGSKMTSEEIARRVMLDVLKEEPNRPESEMRVQQPPDTCEPFIQLKVKDDQGEMSIAFRRFRQPLIRKEEPPRQIDPLEAEGIVRAQRESWQSSWCVPAAANVASTTSSIRGASAASCSRTIRSSEDHAVRDFFRQGS